VSDDDAAMTQQGRDNYEENTGHPSGEGAGEVGGAPAVHLPDGSFPPPRRTRLALHWQILIGLVIGAVAGIVARSVYPPGADGAAHPRVAWIIRYIAEPAGQIFLRLIFMVVLPLVFSALVLGVAGLGDPRRLGRVGLRTLLLTIVLSAASVGVGVALVNSVRPGAHLSSEEGAKLREQYGAQASSTVVQVSKSKTPRDLLLDIIPRNPLQEMVGALDGSSPGGGMLAVMFFALLFGLAATAAPERVAPLLAVLEGVYDIVLVIVGMAMRLAPIGVAGLMFVLAASLGISIFQALGRFVLTVLAGLTLHFVLVYTMALLVVARRRPWGFMSSISDALVTAFATSSSNATLPTALRVADEKLGLRREIAGFVLTVGSTANQNGTALYEGVTVLFLAQAFGVELTLTQQIVVAVMAVLGGIGTAGVPSGSIPVIVMILNTVGVPGEAIGIILGVDRLLDMCRTVLNVGGDLVVAACVDRMEGAGTPVPVPAG
jgi:DAACS family dicarboxylate/amino acid:cation (Na+ or H+) symporter